MAAPRHRFSRSLSERVPVARPIGEVSYVKAKAKLFIQQSSGLEWRRAAVQMHISLPGVLRVFPVEFVVALLMFAPLSLS